MVHTLYVLCHAKSIADCSYQGAITHLVIHQAGKDTKAQRK
jgi:hypothetical protein